MKKLKNLKLALKILAASPLIIFIGLIGIILMILGDRDKNDERKTTQKQNV